MALEALTFAIRPCSTELTFLAAFLKACFTVCRLLLFGDNVLIEREWRLAYASNEFVRGAVEWG